MKSLTLVLPLMMIASTASAETLQLRDESEVLQFVDSQDLSQEIQLAPKTSSEHATEVRLGEVVNAETQQSIQIVCQAGTRDSCSQIAFYHIVGARAPEPFKVTTLNSMNRDTQYASKKMRFWVTNRWLVKGSENGDMVGALWITPPVGVALTLVDAVLYPFRGIIRQTIIKPKQREKVNKARAQLFLALSSGGSVEVDQKSFDRIESMIRQIDLVRPIE